MQLQLADQTQLTTGLQDTVAHLKEEEEELLPLLDQMLDGDTKVQLGLQFNAAQARAPTK